MGDETIRFASRFANAVDLLARITTEDGCAALRRRLGPRLEADVAEALDAVAELHETGTEAVRHWSERRARVLAQVSELRAELARGGVDEAVRGRARSLVELLGRRERPRRRAAPRSR